MPDGIYLNANDYTTQELAEEIYSIIRHKERYYNFFKWRNHYAFHGTSEDSHTTHVCDLCAFVNKMRERNETKVYSDIAHWYNGPKEELTTCEDTRLKIYDKVQRS